MTQPDRSPSVTLVVPMYNEEERGAEAIDPLLDFIGAYPSGSRLLLVDDGSDDRTVEVVRARIAARGAGHLAAVLEEPHAGKGAALSAGLDAAEADVAAFCDVDLATPLPELARLIDAAAAGGCLAIGSRATAEAKLEVRESRARELAGRAFNGAVRWLCPGIADTQCGAKAAPTWLWRRLLPHLHQVGFAWDVEVVALALRIGEEVQELGVEWHHDERTKVKVLRDGARMVRALPTIALDVRRAAALETAEPIIDIRPAPVPGRLLLDLTVDERLGTAERR